MTSRYFGTASIQTSTANQEIVPLAPESFTDTRYTFRKFSFINKSATTIKINGGEPIYLEADMGFEIGRDDDPIKSFIVISAGIQYSWIGSI